MPQTIDIPKVGQVEFPDGMSDDDIAKASHKLYTDQLWTEHHANEAAGVRAEKNVRNVETVGNVLGGAVRMGSFIGGPPGAAIGSMAAESIERAGRGENPDPTLGSFPRAGFNAAIAKIPTGWLGKLADVPAPVTAMGRAALGLGEGAIEGAGVGTMAPMLEGHKPTLAGVGTSTLTGSLIKGTMGALQSGPKLTFKTPKDTRAASVQEMHTALGAKTAEEQQAIDTALNDIHHELVESPTGSDFNKVGTKGVKEAVQAGQKRLGKEVWEPELKRFGRNLEPTQGIANRIRNTITEGTPAEDAAAINKVASEFDNQHMSLNKLYERQKIVRQEATNIRKSVNSEILNNPANKAKLETLNALDDTLYDRLSALSGKDFHESRVRYKALKTVEGLAKKADDANVTAKAAEAATKHPVINTMIENKGGMTQGALKAVRQGVRKRMGDPNSPDAMIARSLRRLGGKSQRKPVSQYLSQPPSPTEPTVGPDFNQSMQQYLNLNNVSPEAQQFLGYRKALPPASGQTVLPSSGEKITPSAIPSTQFYTGGPRPPTSPNPFPNRYSIGDELANENIQTIEHPLVRANPVKFRRKYLSEPPKE